jgi:hypothetical protein
MGDRGEPVRSLASDAAPFSRACAAGATTILNPAPAIEFDAVLISSIFL